MKQWSVNQGEFRVVQGDITQQDTDAVVNAANKRLAPGGGVAGAIHSAAGPRLWEHCKELGGCETGEAVITPGFDLPAPHIIHTVGPVYDSHPEPAKALEQSYRNSLRVAEENELDSVSFPLLSTGAFGYPMDEASEIAIQTIRDVLSDARHVREARMVLYGEDDYETFCDVATRIFGSTDNPS